MRRLFRVPWPGDGPLLSLAIFLLPGCGAQRASEDSPAPGGVEDTVTGEPMASLLLRGLIRPDTLILEPSFLLPAAPSAQREGDSGHSLVGFDEAGVTLFDVRLETTPVADIPQYSEEHFHLLLPIAEEQAARLHRVELHAADGRTAARTTTFSPQGLDEALNAPDAVSASRAATGRVLLTWDAGRFPMVMVRDPRNGQILAFGRGGKVIVATDQPTLDVAVSDGVRSRTKTVSVR